MSDETRKKMGGRDDTLQKRQGGQHSSARGGHGRRQWAGAHSLRRSPQWKPSPPPRPTARPLRRCCASSQRLRRRRWTWTPRCLRPARPRRPRSRGSRGRGPSRRGGGASPPAVRIAQAIPESVAEVRDDDDAKAHSLVLYQCTHRDAGGSPLGVHPLVQVESEPRVDG